MKSITDTSALLPFLENGVTQIAWVVKDLKASVKVFYDTFGIGPWHFYRYGRPLLSMMKRNGKNAEYIMDTAVANAGKTRLEIIQPIEGDTIFSEFSQKRGCDGIQHVGIAVESMSYSMEFVKKAGIKVLMEGAGYGLDGDGHFAFLDTEGIIGIVVELMERPKRRHVPYYIYPESGNQL